MEETVHVIIKEELQPSTDQLVQEIQISPELIITDELQLFGNYIIKEEVPTPAKHVCYICNKEFSCSSSQLLHMRKMHNIDTAMLTSKSQGSCPLCNNFKFFKVESFYAHLEAIHNVMVITKHYVFSSYGEFERWKARVEEESNAAFYKPHGDKMMKDGSKRIRFRCSRAGNYRPQGTGQRLLKKQGSRKLNGMCPASMDVTVSKNQSVTVKFVETHCGHSLDELNHLILSKRDKQSIVTQLKMGVEKDKILENARDKVNLPSKRKHLLTRKDLINISKKLKIVNPMDTSWDSIKQWVNEMQQSIANPVLFCKLPEPETSSDALMDNEFCLVVMTESQKNMLLQNGNECICVESTTSIGFCHFEMTVMSVTDHDKDGYPVALMFNSKNDVNSYKIFFEVIKSQVGILRPLIFMSDEEKPFYDAWSCVMGKAENRFLCPWDVMRSWQRQLATIRSTEIQQAILTQLRSILMETDEMMFTHLLETLIQQLCSDSTTKPYADYLVSDYCCQVNQWACCSRKGLGINTNTVMERIERIFKRCYTKGNDAKQLDKPIRSVIKSLQERESGKVIIPHHKSKVGPQVQSIKSRHKDALVSNDIIMLSEIEGQVWYVYCAAVGQVYTVKPNNKSCNCSVTCEECDKCVHNFSCTCPDYQLKRNMCKHIHQVCSKNETTMSLIYLTTENPQPVEYTTETVVAEPDFSDNSDSADFMKAQDQNVDVVGTEAVKARFEHVLQSCHTSEHLELLDETLIAFEKQIGVVDSGNDGS